MQPHVESWARFCATHKYSIRQTLEQAIARKRATLTAVPHGEPCQVCKGALQLGYRVMLPTEHSRLYNVGYIHTDPKWCAHDADRDAARARERIAVETYQQQQQSYRELEALYTAMTERAQRAEALLHEVYASRVEYLKPDLVERIRVALGIERKRTTVEPRR